MTTDLYNVSIKYVLEKLSKNIIVILATCGKNLRVTARSISIVNNELAIFFQSDKEFLKSRQMKENPNVAICFENIQIEGIATNSGHSSLEKNKWFRDTYKKVHPGSFEKFTHLENQVIFEIQPKLITLWKYEDNTSYRVFIDIPEKSAVKEIYQKYN